ncbi:hypothetical protein FAZ79_08710, partial [Guyparkeria sp. SB14A]|uniref:hypothetical protein n=1 Tax=Guyparkeria sp. SB14A TaxID=2571147 RepID=UPI0011383A3E
MTHSRLTRPRHLVWLAGAVTSLVLHGLIVWALLTWTRDDDVLMAANRGGGEPVEAQWVDLSETTPAPPSPAKSTPPQSRPHADAHRRTPSRTPEPQQTDRSP